MWRPLQQEAGFKFHNGPKPAPCIPPAVVAAANTRGCTKGFMSLANRSPLFLTPPVSVADIRSAHAMFVTRYGGGSGSSSSSSSSSGATPITTFPPTAVYGSDVKVAGSPTESYDITDAARDAAVPSSSAAASPIASSPPLPPAQHPHRQRHASITHAARRSVRGADADADGVEVEVEKVRVVDITDAAIGGVVATPVPPEATTGGDGDDELTAAIAAVSAAAHAAAQGGSSVGGSGVRDGHVRAGAGAGAEASAESGAGSGATAAAVSPGLSSTLPLHFGDRKGGGGGGVGLFRGVPVASTVHPGLHVQNRVSGALSPLLCPPMFLAGADDANPSHRMLWYQHHRITVLLFVDFSKTSVGQWPVRCWMNGWKWFWGVDFRVWRGVRWRTWVGGWSGGWVVEWVGGDRVAMMLSASIDELHGWFGGCFLSCMLQWMVVVGLMILR